MKKLWLKIIQNQPASVFPLYLPGRPLERKLLLWVTVVFALGAFILKRAGIDHLDDNLILVAIIITASFWAVHLFLVLRREKSDELFFPLTAFLISLGWLEIYRLQSEMAIKQVYWIIIGEIAFILVLVYLKDYRILEDYKYIFLIAAIVLQASVSVFGQEVHGAKIWFRFKFFSIQPVEFIKIFLAIFLASYLKQNRPILEKPLDKGSYQMIRYYVLPFVLWGIAEAVLIIQKDLGIALLLFGVFLGLFYVTTRRGWLIGLGALLVGAGSFLIYLNFTHARIRFDAWLNPWSAPEGYGYQIIQALFSLANGGLTGAGLGRGQPYFIPAVHTDYIFVALSEELGLIGSLIIICVFLVLIQRMFLCCLNSKDEFSSFLSLGFSLLFASQVFIIIAGSVKLIPLTGITLPFMSYGGSSLVSNFIMLAILMQISSRIKTSRGLQPEKHGGKTG